MAAKMDDDAFYKRVISSCYMKIVEDLDPDPLIDEMIVENFLPSVAIRDIREQRTTSEKNRKIVERVLSRGPEGYSLFIKMLGKSGNEYLRDFIKTKEAKLKANERQKQEQLQQKRAHEKMNPRHPVPVNVPQPSHDKPILFRGGPEDNPIPFPVPRRGKDDIYRQYFPIDPVSVNVPQPSHDKPILFRGGPEDNPIPFPVPRRGKDDISRQNVPKDKQYVEDQYIDFPFMDQQPESANQISTHSKQLKENLPGTSAAANYKIQGPSVLKGQTQTSSELSSNEHIDTDMSKLSVRDDHDEDYIDAIPLHEESGSFRQKFQSMASSLKSTFYEEKYKKIRRSKFDGRIMEISYKKCEEDIRRNIKTERGGFGEVYHVEDKEEDGIGDYVIKKICFIDGDGKERSAASEMLAARLLHFAIVPLLAKAEHPEKGIYYFLFPDMKNGSLADMLSSDRKKIEERDKGIELTKDRRRRILIQLASAIGFLHKEVKGFRGTYIHGDITTRNVVLDLRYNPHLIDFGLARECTAGKEGVTLTHGEMLGTPGYFQTSERSKMSVDTDLFNFGVVILEVLTSLPAKEGDRYLYEYSKTDINHCYEDHDDNIQAVWGNGKNWVDPYLKIAEKCLKKEVKIEEIIDKFKDQCSNDPLYWDDPQVGKKEKRCVMCMINPESSEVSDILEHTRSCNLHLCVPCLRNSYLNPIQCPSCLQTVESPIGNNWAAILVAGNDEYPINREKAQTFYKDMKSMEEAITSRHPLTIGIRRDHVYCVALEKFGEECQLLAQLEESFEKAVSIDQLHTLLFYFSGHFLDKGFLLGGSEEFLSVNKLCRLLMHRHVPEEASKEIRIIVMLDCCNAPYLKLSAPHCQLNACSSYQATNVPFNGKSPFTEFVLQCLKGKSTQKKCKLAEKKKKDTCELCEDLYPVGGLISIEKLKTYVRKHIQSYSDDTVKVTSFATNETIGRNLVCAYFIDFVVEFTFHLEYPQKSKIKHEVTKLPESLEELKRNLFEKFRDYDCFKQLSDEFADMLMIEVRTGPKRHHVKELSSLEQIEDAWIGKRELFVRPRHYEQLVYGKVGCILKTEKTERILNYLKNEKVKPKIKDNVNQTTEVAISLKNDGARRLWSCLKEEKPAKKCPSYDFIKELMNNVKHIQKVKHHEGELVFIFPHQDNGELIKNFFAIDLKPRQDNTASSC